MFFGFHAGRFTVECKEYGNTLFFYFYFFIYVLSNFTLDSRIAKYLKCHIGLQPHTCFVILIFFYLICFIIFGCQVSSKLRKAFNLDPCNYILPNLHVGKDIINPTLNIVSKNLCRHYQVGGWTTVLLRCN